MYLRYLLYLAIPGLVLLAACRSREQPVSAPKAAAEPYFEDITEQVGLDFEHVADQASLHRLPAIMGSGAAFLDANNDGRLDVLLLQNGGPRSAATHTLYLQQPDGHLRKVGAESGLTFAGHGMGVAVGDFDNDGWVDLYLAQYGGGRLFRNRGVGPGGWRGFEDVTDSAGVAQPRWGSSCCFVDIDRDGWLDLFVVNYVDYDPSRPCGNAAGRPDFCHPSEFPGTAARLYRNRGKTPQGHWAGFEDITQRAGLATAPSSGLGAAVADFDGDGWPDLLAANDARANHLWINRRNGTFRDEALARGLAFNLLGQPQANMGVALGDVNGDGLLDVFITHLTEESHVLWQQGPPGLFRDCTSAADLQTMAWRSTGFGTVLADFDHDGWLDLALVTGRVSRGPRRPGPLPPFWQDYAERNQLLLNQGEGRFLDVSSAHPALCGTPGMGRALCWGDFDNDGAIDLLVSHVAGRARLYRNVAKKRGHWLMLRLLDPRYQRDALGARVTARAGSRRWVALVCPGQSYQSSGDARVHLGLGSIEALDELRIDWPCGLAETFPPAGLDRHRTLERGTGTRVSP
ncbi:MAG: CRTAC1 family protein [Gemmataceae bacterium]